MSKQLYSVKHKNSLSILQEDNNKESFFQLKSIHDSVIIQFSSLPIVSVQSVKRPQLSKPKVTAARTQNSIVDGNGEKTLGETRLSRGGSLCRGLVWFPWSCADATFAIQCCHFSKSDEETNSSTSRMAWAWVNSYPKVHPNYNCQQ